MGISIQEVIDNQLISEDVLDVIPHTCGCGAPIAFTDSLRQIYCTNPRCYYKVAARLEAMAKKLRGPDGECCDGWGESTCITVCQEYKMISPFQVFQLPKMIEKGYGSSVAAFEKKVDSICNPKLRKVELWKIVELAGIPSIESIAYKIFGGYHNFEDAFKDIEEGQVPFIANKLGVKNSETSVMAVNVYNTLIEYKDELIYGEKQFEIYEPTGTTLYMCITGGVRGFRNKSEFVQYINNRYDGKVNAMLMNSVTTQVELLVADGDTGSNKYKTATRLNSKFIEKGLKSGDFTTDEIGKFKNPKDMHPVGELIYIGDSEEIIERLDKVFGD
jgi:NAD-dependent DNA ligase